MLEGFAAVRDAHLFTGPRKLLPPARRCRVSLLTSQPSNPTSVPEQTPFIHASLLIPSERGAAIASALNETDLAFEAAGAPRGVVNDVVLFIVATPSIAACTLLLEKLRRLRLPRTYVRLRDGELEVWLDPSVNDGQTFVVYDDGSMECLGDSGLSVESLVALLRARRDVDG